MNTVQDVENGVKHKENILIYFRGLFWWVYLFACTFLTVLYFYMALLLFGVGY